MRGQVCNSLVEFAVTLRSQSCRTHDHILLSHLTLPQPGGPGPCIYIPQEEGGPVIPTGHWVPFLSPLTTSGAMGEVFSPAFTRVRQSQSQPGVRHPSENRDQFFPFSL
jgi:hypothetical protein